MSDPSTTAPRSPAGDAHIEALAEFFATHPACVEWGKPARARSREDPDFAFCFPPSAIDHITTAGDDVGGLALPEHRKIPRAR